MRASLLVSLLVGALVGAAPRVALADADAARAHKDAAYTAYELGRYGEAIRHYEKAYALKRDPRLLYNIALAYLKRSELKRSAADRSLARQLFERFMRAVQPSDKRYRGQRRTIVAMRRLARRYLREIAAADGAAASRPTSRPTSSRPSASRRAPARTVPAAAPRDGGAARHHRSRVHWYLYGVTALLGSAAAITGGLALRAASRADERAAAGDLQGNHDAVDRSKALAISTDVLLASAALSAVVAVVLHVLDARRHRVSVAVAPLSARLQLRF